MSLQPQVVYLVPEETARVARAAFPRGNVYMHMRDTFGMIYDDQTFASLFPLQGQPAVSPFRLALTTVMQFAENLSDLQAADAVRSRLDWKYALGLELTDSGFDASVLSEFRTRLVAGAGEHLLLDTMLTLFREQGLLKVRGKQRTDSTHVLANIRILNRLECVGTTLRHALNTLALVAPDWLHHHIDPEWFDRYGPRFENYRLPKAETDRQAFAAQVGNDGVRLLEAVYAPTTPPWLREVPAVEILRRIWIQQYYVVTGTVCVRGMADIPPAALLINSPFDLQARYSMKRDIRWTGYKAHITETCDPELPHLITHVATTPGTTQDSDVTATIQADLAAADLLPSEHFMDEGYIDAELVVNSHLHHHVALVGPVARDASWQAAEHEGYDITQFQVDWDTQTVHCPQGKTSAHWKPYHDPRGKRLIHIAFQGTDCRPCLARAVCTRAKLGRRQLTLRPRQEFEVIQVARARQQTPSFKAKYAQRAGIEGTLSQGVRRCNLRRARYSGLAKTHLQHIITAVALNVVRVLAWHAEVPRATTRQSHFAALARLNAEPAT
jgi:transposase